MKFDLEHCLYGTKTATANAVRTPAHHHPPRLAAGTGRLIAPNARCVDGVASLLPRQE
jgi:hypothetical protein